MRDTVFQLLFWQDKRREKWWRAVRVRGDVSTPLFLFFSHLVFFPLKTKIWKTVSHSCGVIFFRKLYATWCWWCVRDVTEVFSVVFFLFFCPVNFRKSVLQGLLPFVKKLWNACQIKRRQFLACTRKWKSNQSSILTPKSSRVKLNSSWFGVLEYLIDLTFTLSSGNFSVFLPFPSLFVTLIKIDGLWFDQYFTSIYM